MDSVVHFEMPFDDPARMSEFYTAAFGWQTMQLGEEMGHYILATTTESDETGPKNPGAINGGFYPRNPEMPAQIPSFVIGVTDIRESMKKVITAGGVVEGEPMEIPGIGQFVRFIDTEGNVASMLQPLPRA